MSWSGIRYLSEELGRMVSSSEIDFSEKFSETGVGLIKSARVNFTPGNLEQIAGRHLITGHVVIPFDPTEFIPNMSINRYEYLEMVCQAALKGDFAHRSVLQQFADIRTDFPVSREDFYNSIAVGEIGYEIPATVSISDTVEIDTGAFPWGRFYWPNESKKIDATLDLIREDTVLSRWIEFVTPGELHRGLLRLIDTWDIPPSDDQSKITLSQINGMTMRGSEKSQIVSRKRGESIDPVNFFDGQIQLPGSSIGEIGTYPFDENIDGLIRREVLSIPQGSLEEFDRDPNAYIASGNWRLDTHKHNASRLIDRMSKTAQIAVEIASMEDNQDYVPVAVIFDLYGSDSSARSEFVDGFKKMIKATGGGNPIINRGKEVTSLNTRMLYDLLPNTLDGVETSHSEDDIFDSESLSSHNFSTPDFQEVFGKDGLPQLLKSMHLCRASKLYLDIAPVGFVANPLLDGVLTATQVLQVSNEFIGAAANARQREQLIEDQRRVMKYLQKMGIGGSSVLSWQSGIGFHSGEAIKPCGLYATASEIADACRGTDRAHIASVVVPNGTEIIIEGIKNDVIKMLSQINNLPYEEVAMHLLIFDSNDLGKSWTPENTIGLPYFSFSFLDKNGEFSETTIVLPTEIKPGSQLARNIAKNNLFDMRQIFIPAQISPSRKAREVTGNYHDMVYHAKNDPIFRNFVKQAIANLENTFASSLRPEDFTTNY